MNFEIKYLYLLSTVESSRDERNDLSLSQTVLTLISSLDCSVRDLHFSRQSQNHFP